MKHLLNLLLYPLFFLLFLSSCEYENSGLYEPKVNQYIDPPKVQVVQLDLKEDTLFLIENQLINFRFQSSNDVQKILFVQLYLDGNLLKTVYADNGFFELDYNTLLKGAHRLMLRIITKTGTNSIADQINDEGFVFNSKEWIVIVVDDSKWPGELNIDQSNGYLKLSWPKYRSSSFKKYVIYYNCENVSHSEDFEIGQTTNNEFIDSSYIGQGGKYIVKILSIPESTFAPKVKYLAKEFPSLKFTSNEDNVYKISWTKSKYLNLIDSFIIKSYISLQREITLKTTVNSNDTTYLINDGNFGDSKEYRLYLVPKVKNRSYYPDYHYNNINCELGIPLKNFNANFNTFYQINNDELFFIRNDSLSRFSISKNSVLQQKDYNSLSNWYYSTIMGTNYITTISNPNTKILRVSLRDLNSYKISNIPFIKQPTCPVISDTGIGIVEGNDNYLYYYNFNNDSILGKYPSDPYLVDIQLSSSGNYFMRRFNGYIKLVEYKNSTFKVINDDNLLTFNKKFGFIPNEVDQIYMWFGSTFYIKNCNDFSTIREFNFQDEVILNIDFYNKRILSAKNLHLYVKNFINGEIINDIPISFQIVPGAYPFLLVNHKIYSFKNNTCYTYNLN